MYEAVQFILRVHTLSELTVCLHPEARTLLAVFVRVLLPGRQTSLADLHFRILQSEQTDL